MALNKKRKQIISQNREESKLYYHECEYCKATLDPGEKCDCVEKSYSKVDKKKGTNKYNRYKKEQRLSKKN